MSVYGLTIVLYSLDKHNRVFFSGSGSFFLYKTERLFNQRYVPGFLKLQLVSNLESRNYYFFFLMENNQKRNKKGVS